ITTNPSEAVNLLAKAGVTQTAAGVITTGTLTATVTGDLNLSVAANSVGTLGAVTVSGGNFRLSNTPALTLSGSIGVDDGKTLQIATAGSLTLSGTLSAGPSTGTGTIDLSGAGITQSAGSIAAGNLLVGSTGTVS